MNTPFEHYFDLGGLTAAGQDIHLVAKPENLKRIAQWADLQDLAHFEARIALRKLSQSHFSYEADMKADVVQSCVVSLVPVPAHIERVFTRELHLVSRLPRDLAAHGDAPILPMDDEGAEQIESPRFDLAAPLLEEFSLALEPYPRAPGVAFESPEGYGAERESPFAMLKTLKSKD